jgi:hypothetical protein
MMLALVALAGREGRAEDRSHGWDGRVFLGINGGYNPATGALAYGDSQTVFGEEASARATLTGHRAPALDVGGGVRLLGPFGIGATVSAAHAKQNTTLTVAVPHPLFFNRPATATAADSRHRNEVALHLQAIVMAPLGRKLRLSLFGGPSRFWVHQPLPSDVELEPTLHDDLSFTIAMPTMAYETVRASAWGFHAGGELTFLVSRNVSIGALTRYSRGIAHAQNALVATRTSNEQRTLELELGGLAVTGGLTLWF